MNNDTRDTETRLQLRLRPKRWTTIRERKNDIASRVYFKIDFDTLLVEVQDRGVKHYIDLGSYYLDWMANCKAEQDGSKAEREGTANA